MMCFGESSLRSNYTNIDILTEARPPAADTLLSLYPLAVILTYKKLSSQFGTAMQQHSSRNWGLLQHLRGGYIRV
jgi:hypothetical protein